MSEVRLLESVELQEYQQLCAFAFQYTLPEESAPETHKDQQTRPIFGVFEDSQLLGGMEIIPFHTYIYGKAIPMGGIAGVATWPEYRRQGVVKTLLQWGILSKKPSIRRL